MKKYKMHYWIFLGNDKCYDHKKRWWVNYEDAINNCSSCMEVKNVKKVNAALRRLEHENYTGKVFVTRFCNHVKGKGHLTEDFIIDYSKVVL